MAVYISTKSLFLLSSIIIAHNPVKADASEETSGEFNKTSDYVEEKNHSEAIQKILRNFEKTLDDNRKLYDLDHVDTVTLEDVEDAVSDTGVPRSPGATEEEVSSDSDMTETTARPGTEEEAGADNSTARSRLACNNTGSPIVTEPRVMLVNGSLYQTLLYEEHNASVTNRSQSATCSITLFFASWCEFSAAAAPHYNALARVFPQMRYHKTELSEKYRIKFLSRLYAVDSGEHHSLNTQFGVMAVPSIFVFHNGRPLYKYNYSEYNLASFTQTFSLLTGLSLRHYSILCS